ncbi:MAG: tRNA lysidine(34) synthetase TilS [Ilumatobacteraceae bacterium]|nr:tRNA lysidine(34) synthetase TilS [Ilumatobacteraceae bacterium]
MSQLIAELLDQCTFPPSATPVSCAVSGGADSMALMVLAVNHGLRVTAHHVNHSLRHDSDADVELVSLLAKQLGVEVVTHRVSIERGANLEARARSARYGVLPSDIMTGHTADDQAETMLINLMRGAATQGLSAMTPGIGRPLLQLRRTDTHALCAELDISVVHDHTNDDTSYLRNNIRHNLLPAMNTMSQRDLVPILTRAANVMRDDNELLDILAAALDPTDAVALTAAPLALARRALRTWLSHPYPPDQATIERVLMVASGARLACDIGGGREIRRSKQRLVLGSVR